LQDCFTDVVHFLENNRSLLEKWLGRRIQWPNSSEKACGVKLTFEGSGLNSWPSGSSVGCVLLLTLLQLLAKVRMRGVLAVTGIVSPSGMIHPVGSVLAKATAAKRMGVRRVVIPAPNYRALCRDNSMGSITTEELEIVPARDVVELLHACVEGQRHIDHG
jgi:hypothetical protein